MKDYGLDAGLSLHWPIDSVTVAEALARIGYADNAAGRSRDFGLGYYVRAGTGDEGRRQTNQRRDRILQRSLFRRATVTGRPLVSVRPCGRTSRHALVAAAAQPQEIDRIGRSRGRDGQSCAAYFTLSSLRRVIPQDRS